jgi:hypothetical protein
MGLITSGIVLLITLFTLDQIYTLLQRNISKIPVVKLSWIDLITWKQFQSIFERGYHTVSLMLCSLARVYKKADSPVLVL